MPVEIIAEIGVNHNGDLDIARKLIDAAREAGADTVKFQASVPENEVSALYEPEHLAMLKRLIPDMTFLMQCKIKAEQIGLRFLCTPADVQSLRALVMLGVDRIKIGSDNLTNAQMLREAHATGMPRILSTGMAFQAEIDHAINYVGAFNLTLMHCTSAYPCPIEDANLGAIQWLRSEYPKQPIGWSDHTTSTTLAAIAVGMGAVMIEKHLTLSMWDEGPDHRASLEPMLFATMVANIREAELAFGKQACKVRAPSEAPAVHQMRKSLMASKIIRKGETFTEDNLTAKRPGWGRSAMDYYAVLGTVSAKDYSADEMVD